jgi:hypothetical protein
VCFTLPLRSSIYGGELDKRLVFLHLLTRSGWTDRAVHQGFYVYYKCRGLAFQRCRQLEDHGQGRLVHAPLDQTDVVALHTSFKRQLLLCETCAFPAIAKNLPKCQPFVQTVHPLREGALSMDRQAESSQYTVNISLFVA